MLTIFFVFVLGSVDFLMAMYQWNAASKALQLGARHDDLLAHGCIDEDGRNRMGEGVLPRRADIFHRLAHADRIDLR